jgi:hypothetical protein
MGTGDGEPGTRRKEPSSMMGSGGADCGEGEEETGSLSTTMEAGDGEKGTREEERPPSVVGLAGPSCCSNGKEGCSWSATTEGQEGLGTRDTNQSLTTGRTSASQSMAETVDNATASSGAQVAKSPHHSSTSIIDVSGGSSTTMGIGLWRRRAKRRGRGRADLAGG